MEIRHYNSPNFSKKTRSVNSIKLVVIHYTGMQSERESIIRLCNPKSKVSSHFLINQNGKTYRLVQDEKIIRCLFVKVKNHLETLTPATRKNIMIALI